MLGGSVDDDLRHVVLRIHQLHKPKIQRLFPDIGVDAMAGVHDLELGLPADVVVQVVIKPQEAFGLARNVHPLETYRALHAGATTPKRPATSKGGTYRQEISGPNVQRDRQTRPPPNVATNGTSHRVRTA